MVFTASVAAFDGQVGQHLHEVSVADGLLQAASGSNTLIVVGNPWCRTSDGVALGIVAETVLRGATSDVVVVQTTAIRRFGGARLVEVDFRFRTRVAVQGWLGAAICGVVGRR